tara:strand:+ start:1252 stop:1533 length:282 start_codon:yes stop_codon:yes gene_type:complete
MKIQIHHTYHVTEINNHIELPDNYKEITGVFVEGKDLIVRGLDSNSEKFSQRWERNVFDPVLAEKLKDYSRPYHIEVWDREQNILYEWTELEF